ncbi:hypothetical protein N7457_000708 [Penicillium paradoxum]|uniref:uncharacterized protein n=1 Tax=Penicillium paradoxum TaxID=176176 RepID=UPI0025483AF7|nr:uncharacterized protein N7457_000708 [Penicillium paradoxum]KAJ5794109.1 hypothetical protein N7457_000708 [Penicillium paradoxum]
MDFLPENLQTVLQNPTFAYLQSTTQDHLTENLSHLRTMVLQPYLIEPASAFLATYSGSMPDVLSVLVLIVIFFVSIRILKYAAGVFLFWVFLVAKILFWGVILGVGWYVYNAGVENASRDAGRLWGIASGFVGNFEEKSKTAAAAYAGITK